MTCHLSHSKEVAELGLKLLLMIPKPLLVTTLYSFTSDYNLQ